MPFPSARKTSEPAKEGVTVSFGIDSGPADAGCIQETAERTSERFLRLAEVQQMFCVSRSTVWRWTAENGLKVVRIGNVTRIRESDLNDFLSRRETGAQSQSDSAGGQSR